MKKLVPGLLAVIALCFAILIMSPQKGISSAQLSSSASQKAGNAADVPDPAGGEAAGLSAQGEASDASAAGTAADGNVQAEDTADPGDSAAAETVREIRTVSVAGKSFSTGAQMLDLSGITAGEAADLAAVLPEMQNLRYVNLGDESSGLSLSDLDALYDAAPDTLFAFGFTFMNQSVNTYDKVLDLNHIAMTDEGAAVRKILPYMRNLETLDMDSCGVSNTAMDAIRQDYPAVKVIWRIWFGDNYTVRTDVTKILASKPSWGGMISNESAQVIRYCTDVTFLDLGHNEELSDFSFVSCLKELRVAVVSITSLADLTPFASCPKLWYIEAGNCKISDLSPLAACTNLEHLNVGTNFDVKDISCLYDLNLKRLWLGVADPVPAEQVTKMQELHPDIEIDTTVPTGLEVDEEGKALNEGFVMGRWKTYKQWLYDEWVYASAMGSFPAAHPKSIYRVIYDGFEYEKVTYAYSFASNDPLVDEHASIYTPTELPKVQEEDTPNVSYFCADSTRAEQWQAVAAAYTEETGVPVSVSFAGEEENYLDALQNVLEDIDGPTLFDLNGGVDLDVNGMAGKCADLSDSEAAQNLLYSGFAMHENGAVIGLAQGVEAYGLFVNTDLLEKAGYTLDDISTFEGLKAVTEDVTARRGVSIGFGAFVVPDMKGYERTDLTIMLVNLPIAQEFDSRGIEFTRNLDARAFSGYRSLWNLIMYNSLCSNYDLNPAAYVIKTEEDSRSEFRKGEAMFYIAYTSEYEALLASPTVLTQENLTMIPLYDGVGEEASQGLCIGSDRFWCVNAAASETDRTAAEDFLTWCTSSEKGTQMMADMGLDLPYADAVTPEDPYLAEGLQQVRDGKRPVLWYFSAMPTESWRDEVCYEMGACGADLGDWTDIYNEVVNVWAAEYIVR